MNKLCPVREALVQKDDKWEEWGLEELTENLRLHVERNPLRVEESNIGKPDGSSKHQLKRNETLLFGKSWEMLTRASLLVCTYTVIWTIILALTVMKVLIVESRKSILRQNNMCYNCTGTGHIAAECKFLGCKKCQRKHHKFLKTFFDRKMYFNTSLYLSNTADWQSKARAKINFTISERFRKHMNPGSASSIFKKTSHISLEEKEATAYPNVGKLKQGFARLRRQSLSKEETKGEMSPVHIILGAGDYQMIRTTDPPVHGNNPDKDHGAEFTKFDWTIACMDNTQDQNVQLRNNFSCSLLPMRLRSCATSTCWGYSCQIREWSNPWRFSWTIDKKWTQCARPDGNLLDNTINNNQYKLGNYPLKSDLKSTINKGSYWRKCGRCFMQGHVDIKS